MCQKWDAGFRAQISANDVYFGAMMCKRDILCISRCMDLHMSIFYGQMLVNMKFDSDSFLQSVFYHIFEPKYTLITILLNDVKEYRRKGRLYYIA